MSQRRGSNRRQTTTTTEESSTLPSTTALPETQGALPVIAFVIVGVCIALLIVFIIGLYCYKKKRHQSDTKIGPIQPETPQKAKAEIEESKSIESLRYNSPTASEKQRVFSIETDRSLNQRQSSDEPLVISSRTDVEAQLRSAKEAVAPAVTGSGRSGGFFSGLLSGRSSPLSCFRGKSSDSQLMTTDVKTIQGSTVTGGAGGPGLKMGRAGDTLLPPIEGKVPFNKDIDAFDEVSDDDTKSDISDAILMADEPAMGIKAAPEKATKVLAAFGTVGKKEPTPAPSRQGAASSIFGVTSTMVGGHTSSASKSHGRRKSAACQTSLNGSVVNIPGLVESPDIRHSAQDVGQEPELAGGDRKYFIYLISDNSGGFFKKDCVGRLVLPGDLKKLTLSELRDKLFKSDDEDLRQLVRLNRQFRFVTETYKFVPQTETVAPVDDIYPAQGIFIKFTDGAILPDHIKGSSPLPPRKIMPSFLNLSEADVKGSKSPSVSPLFTRTYQQPSYARPISRKGNSEMDLQRSEVLRRRHIDCISPLPLKHKEARRKHLQAQSQLYLDVRKKCDNGHCGQRPVFKCAKCSVAAYCSAKCKKDHWFDHRLACSRPPWRC